MGQLSVCKNARLALATPICARLFGAPLGITPPIVDAEWTMDYETNQIPTDTITIQTN